MLLYRFVMVLLAQQKYGALSTYPIGSERWNQIRVLLLDWCRGTMKAIRGRSFGIIQIYKYASAMSTLDRKTGFQCRSMQRMWHRR